MENLSGDKYLTLFVLESNFSIFSPLKIDLFTTKSTLMHKPGKNYFTLC